MTKIWSPRNLQVNVLYVNENRKISTVTAYQTAVAASGNPDRKPDLGMSQRFLGPPV
jgi:hypothetical protein